MIKKIIKLLNYLDSKGFSKEADYLDRMIKLSAEEYFHLSPVKFDSFEQQYNDDPRKASDVGFHFGTRDTALTVADKLKKEGKIEAGDSVYLYGVSLDANSPVHLSENRLGSWSIFSILNELFEGFGGGAHPAISEEMIDDYYDDIITTPSGENLKDLDYDPALEINEFASWLNSIGFDSIKYENTYEGGGESIIVFSPSQITINSVQEYKV